VDKGNKQQGFSQNRSIEHQNLWHKRSSIIMEKISVAFGWSKLCAAASTLLKTVWVEGRKLTVVNPLTP